MRTVESIERNNAIGQLILIAFCLISWIGGSIYSIIFYKLGFWSSFSVVFGIGAGCILLWMTFAIVIAESVGINTCTNPLTGERQGPQYHFGNNDKGKSNKSKEEAFK